MPAPNPGPLASLGEHWAVEYSLLELAGQATRGGRWEREVSAFFCSDQTQCSFSSCEVEFPALSKIKSSALSSTSSDFRQTELEWESNRVDNTEVVLALGQIVHHSGDLRSSVNIQSLVPRFE